ncbi:MAG: MATE family efflux transporter [Pseudomonadales bacterium]|nr:MATE family efflux transporter [Pseudomonadales bacterium]MBO7005540.1 MATE family efflux transporter [Pseudomonadales bacterium]
MGAQLAQMGMGVADTIMAGRYGSADLAGVALGSSILWPSMMLVFGVVQAVTPTVSQLNGARAYAEIGDVIRQGLWMALIGGFIVVTILNNIEPVYHLMRVDPVAVAISVPYLKWCSLGMPALMCFFCLRFLADGTGWTRPALIIAVSALMLKIPLNYVLIYGKFGLPEMGGVGCGVAQAIIMWFQLFLVLMVVTRKRFAHTGWMDKFSWPDWRIIKSLLVIGIPIGLTIFAEMGLFSFTTLLLGQFGAAVVASHNIAMNLNAIFFMPPMALGMAATIRIGFRVGAQEIEDARLTALIAVVTTAAVAIGASILIYCFREDLVSLYTTEPAVLTLSVTLLLFVVFFLFFDASQAVCVGALRGYKDTKIPMWIALFSYWGIGLPTQIIFGFGFIGEPMEVYGFWLGLAAGVGSAAVLLGARLVYVSGNIPLIRRLAREADRQSLPTEPTAAND